MNQADGSHVPTVVSLYDAVFNGTNWVDPTPTGGADDYRTAIEFVHDNGIR